MGPPAFLDDTCVADRYRLVAVLGTGGMGVVYEAVDERLGRPVALKLVHTTDPTSVARLRAEATVLARLRHPNLVTVFDAGEHDGRPFIVTELIRGRSLRQRFDEGAVPGEELARMGTQVASALACVHSHGIVHRDLTPGNVLLTDEVGDARLIDFGIAVTEHTPGLTSTGVVIGTPAYLSPEQVEGRTATTASDVYSLGLVLLEALQGHQVFPGTPTESAGARLVSDAPVSGDLPPDWGPLLTAMTRRDPELRPDAVAVARRLAALPAIDPSPKNVTTAAVDLTRPMVPVGDVTTSFEPTMATPAGRAPVGPSAPAAKRRRWPLVIAGTALLAGLLGLTAFGLSVANSQGPGIDPTPSVAPADQSAVTPTTPVPAPITLAPIPTTLVPTPTTPATKDQGAGSDQTGQGKGKGRAG